LADVLGEGHRASGALRWPTYGLAGRHACGGGAGNGEALVVDLSGDVSLKRNNQSTNHIDAIDPRFGSFPDLNELIREGKLPGPPLTADLAPDDLLESYRIRATD